MAEPDRPEVYVHLLPAHIPAGALQGGVAIVVDVLRATTVMIHALAAGCVSVIPCIEIADAQRVAVSLPDGLVLTAGERQGLPIDGFDLGNSPDDFTPERCSGRTLVMTTTNGTLAIHACLDADRVVIGAFPNFAATVQLLHSEERPIHIVCAGTDGHISYEDSLLAGAFAKHFKDLGGTLSNDAAHIVAGLWARVEDSIWVKSGDLAAERNPLVRYLTRGRGGQRILSLGLAADIGAAARFNTVEPRLAAELERDPLRIVPVRH